jgi:hypothetical protein
MAETTPKFDSYLPELRKRFDRLGKEAAARLRKR